MLKRRTGSLPILCCWGNGKSSRDLSVRKNDINPRSVKKYLEHHPGVLLEVMRNLVSAKPYRRRSSTLSNTSVTNTAVLLDPTQFQESVEYQSSFYLNQTGQPSVSSLLYHSGQVLAKALPANWFSLYVPRNINSELVEYGEDGQTKPHGPISNKTTVSAEAALHRSTIVVKDLHREVRSYPDGVGHPDRDVHRVLSMPISLPSGDFLGVVEFCRDGFKEHFNEAEMELCNSYFDWMVTSLHQAKITRLLSLQTKLNGFILENCKTIVDDKVGLEGLVETILMSLKEVIYADRCTMFLVDEKSDQLYAHYFDEGFMENGKTMFSKKQNIRFPCDKGIAGHVYRTGETVNIINAYNDGRFNPEVDKQTGYHTTSILCMPIVNKFRVVGVLQMINSLNNDHFTPADEDAFNTYAVYSALALHCARLSNMLKISEALCEVSMEVLRFHMVSPQAEAEELVKSVPIKTLPVSFNHFSFVAYPHDDILPHLFIHMIHDLFGKNKFDIKILCRFILTVKKNYRPIPFHNWHHAIQVAHTLYYILKDNKKIFTMNEMMAFITAGVCHDMTNMGYNNVFYEEFDHPMALLYNSSIAENTHYKHTVSILELKDHNIFAFLPKNEYKLLLNEIYEATISTDMALYFGNQRIVAERLRTKTFDLKKYECRRAFKGLLMLGADLCSVAKDWDVHFDMTKDLYLEFYKQGDEEKKRGLQSIVLLDRKYEKDIPKQQVNFFEFICKPLYVALQNVLPIAQPLLANVYKNLEQWRQLAEKNKQSK